MSEYPNALRVEWFERAYERIRDDVLDEAPPAVTLFVGFPVRKRSGGMLAVGECQFERMKGRPEFGAENIITIHPILLEQPIEALAALVHEMIHHALPPDIRHGKEFQNLAKRIGLQKPWTATTADDRLAKYLNGVAAELGDLPRGVFEPAPPKAKKPSANRKLLCGCDSPRILLLSPAKMAQGPVLCGVCRKEFTEEGA